VLWITLLVLVAALFVVFWGLSAFLQPYLYSEPASNLPARAVGAAVVVGLAVGVWTYANAKSDRKGKYGPLHDFDSTGTTDVYEFTAVRQYADKGPDGMPKEEKAVFHRPEGQKSAAFTEEKTGKPFQLNTSTFKTMTLEVKDADGKVTKFEAVTDGKGNYVPDKRFDEKGTKRHLDADAPGVIYAPSTKTMVFAILLNLANYLAWFAAFWLVLRFAFPHAAGLAVIFGLLTMLVVGPMMFERVRGKEAPAHKFDPVVAPSVPNLPDVTDPQDKDVKK
jgi:hypothetical protein